MYKKYLLLIIAGNLFITLHAMEQSDPGASTSSQSSPHNLLLEARYKNDIEGMKKAILEGANPNDYYANPLLHAVIVRDIPFIRFLLEHGANPDFVGATGSARFFTQLYLRNKPVQKQILELFGKYSEKPATGKAAPRQQ